MQLPFQHIQTKTLIFSLTCSMLFYNYKCKTPIVLKTVLTVNMARIHGCDEDELTFLPANGPVIQELCWRNTTSERYKHFILTAFY